MAHFAALALGIPDVSILTAAGPGYWDAAFASPAAGGATATSLLTTVSESEANTRAVNSICTKLYPAGIYFTRGLWCLVPPPTPNLPPSL